MSSSETVPNPKSSRRARPLSPHLQVYKPQITSVMSILHRMTGVGLSFALPVLVWFLVALAEGPAAYKCFMDCAHSIIGQIVLFGWIWAFCYHFCCGIRHLLWDSGYFLAIDQVKKTGVFALVFSTVLTLGLWYNIIWCKP